MNRWTTRAATAYERNRFGMSYVIELDGKTVCEVVGENAEENAKFLSNAANYMASVEQPAHA